MENDGILLTDEQRDTVYKDLEHQKLEITRIQLNDNLHVNLMENVQFWKLLDMVKNVL